MKNGSKSQSSVKIKYMDFKNTEMKIDQIVGYLNDDKINLSPAFQRGHVWTKPLRSSLLHNILSKKPIPAIFLYKKEDGSKYSYNILDGKQRIESLILFISDKGKDLKIDKWSSYFSDASHRKDENFKITLNEKKYSIQDLPENILRDFREYQIPTVEINLNDETSLDEIISLFVDINQKGVVVTRFQIVKAMCRTSKILTQSLNMVAIKRDRSGRDPYYLMKNNSINIAIKNLSVIDKTIDKQIKIDKVWEKLIEILLFLKDKKHKKPSTILKGFINQKDKDFNVSFSALEINKIRVLFDFYRKLYTNKEVKSSPLGKDQIHFYTSITSIIEYDLLSKYGFDELSRKVGLFSQALLLVTHVPAISKGKLKAYLQLSQKSTADSDNRTKRGELFADIISTL